MEVFLRFVLREISKTYDGKPKRDMETQVKSTLGTRKLVLAGTFYKVLALIDLEVDAVCDKLFKGYKFSKIELKPNSENKLKDFLSIFIQDARSIATAANIENSRLNRLLSGEFKELYPDEVYGLAKAFGLNPSQLFEYFYCDGPRPVVGG